MEKSSKPLPFTPSKTEEFLLQEGYEFQILCVSENEDLRRFLLRLYNLECKKRPGTELAIWSDGTSVHYWLHDISRTLRPADITLRPESDLQASGGTGPTVRSDPPEGEVGEIPSLAPPPPNKGDDLSGSTGIPAINPPPPESNS